MMAALCDASIRCGALGQRKRHAASAPQRQTRCCRARRRGPSFGVRPRRPDGRDSSLSAALVLGNSRQSGMPGTPLPDMHVRHASAQLLDSADGAGRCPRSHQPSKRSGTVARHAGIRWRGSGRHDGGASGCERSGLVGDRDGGARSSRRPCAPGAGRGPEEPENSIAAVPDEGRTVRVSMRRLNSSRRRPVALLVLALFRWLEGWCMKVDSRSPASSRLSARGRWRSRHLRGKALRRAMIPAAVSAQIVSSWSAVTSSRGFSGAWAGRLRCSRMVHRCAGTSVHEAASAPVEAGLAVDDEEVRAAQPAADQVVEHGAPSLRDLASHVPGGEQHLLPVVAHADRHRPRGRAGCQASRSVLTLRQTRRTTSLPTPSVNTRRERAAHAAGVGAGEAGGGDQRVGGLRAAPAAAKGRAPPFARRAVRRDQARAGHRDRGRSEAAGLLPHPGVPAGLDRIEPAVDEVALGGRRGDGLVRA